MDTVEVVSMEDAGYYADKYISGSTIKVTLQRGEDYATCDGIVLWEEEYCDSDLFDEWVACAVGGEEGYTATLQEGGQIVEYSAAGKRVVE